MTLERILLKFDKLQDVLGYVKDVFVGLAGGAEGLGPVDLEKALKNLKGSSSLRKSKRFLTSAIWSKQDWWI